MDRRQQAEEAGGAIESTLKYGPPLTKEAWRRMQGCYKEATNRTLPPAHFTIASITTDRVALYTRVTPPLGENILVGIDPFPIGDYFTRGMK